MTDLESRSELTGKVLSDAAIRHRQGNTPAPASRYTSDPGPGGDKQMRAFAFNCRGNVTVTVAGRRPVVVAVTVFKFGHHRRSESRASFKRLFRESRQSQAVS